MSAESPENQFRMRRLQVFNWGTFSGLHDIPIAERGFLFVGHSGAGKTTLLDAFSALLVPPKWIDFNAAAREGDRTGRDRSLVSYVRGAWAEQKDEISGEIATQYLRQNTTWSALALTYENGAGRTVVLAQLFWIRGKSGSRDDLRRYFLIFERPFDLREAADFHLDIRKLKQQLPDAFGREDFSPYAERFRRLVGIDNELALRLLHKTQSAKNLSDLNTFLRDFMLDKPETFDAAERLVAEFAELNAAHQAVVTARDQIQLLAPARQDYRELETVRAAEVRLNGIRQAVDGYKELCRVGLLEKRIRELDLDLEARRAECATRQAEFDNGKAALRDLERRIREAGGQQIEDLEAEKKRIEETRALRLTRRNEVQRSCAALGWPMPAAPHDFAVMTAAARRQAEELTERQDQDAERRAELSEAVRKAQSDLAEAVEEAESLRRQASNVPASSLRLRARIAAELGLAEAALPFAAELIEVLPKDADWRGAIERVLRGFALSVLVEERYYAAVSEMVNREPLGDRLVYHRVGRAEPAAKREVPANSLVRKLQIKPGTLAVFLDGELRNSFNLACVDSMQAFRNTEWSLTIKGQMRRGKSRHEKDDRFDLNDRARWVLGFDNREKRDLFERRAQMAAAKLSECDRRLRDLRETSRKRTADALVCQTLSNLQWQEIDVAPLLDRLDAISRALASLREDSAVLRDLSREIAHQDKRVKGYENALIEVKGGIASLEKEAVQHRRGLESLRRRFHDIQVSEEQSEALSGYFRNLSEKPSLDNLDRLAQHVERALNSEQKSLADKHHQLTRAIEQRFGDFKREWRLESGDMDATLASAPDFFARLTRLETDRLPEYEERFFDLLRNQSHQNLAALSTHISQARKTIFDRLEIVNQSLIGAEFNTGTHLHIAATDRNIPEVKEFRAEIQKALSHAWTGDRQEAEERFRLLRGLVDRLASQEVEQKRWRSLVLDVRLHVEFLGRETALDGTEVEVYRGGGGKSGGQRQKLATTCLAAALRYQLGGEDGAPPSYAPVILDEAFDKADNEFTSQSMKIFEGFGFQMIVATPIKSVMTLEPFIGGACFVDITERRQSSVLLIEYDSERQRLRLPEQIREDAHAAVS